jgi:hypothetical protein
MIEKKFGGRRSKVLAEQWRVGYYGGSKGDRAFYLIGLCGEAIIRIVTQK